jgi:FMN reductase
LEALQVALQGATRAGAETYLLSVRELALPILEADQPDWELDAVQVLLASVRRAHALIVASPVYQETVSGALKNALDYLYILEQEEPPGLSGKAVGLVSVSASLPSMSTSLALQTACKGLGGWILPEFVNLGGSSFDLEGKLCDLLARDRLLALGYSIVAGARARQAEDEIGAAVGTPSTPEGM